MKTKSLKRKLLASLLSSVVAVTAFGALGSVTTASAEEHTHTYVNGFCETVEGETHYEEPKLNDNGTESDTTDDYYEIGNAGNLYWFAEHVNYREDNTVPNIDVNAKLTADIVVNKKVIVNGELNEEEKDSFRVWTPIGYLENNVGGYSGTFDGQGYTVSGLYFNNGEKTNVGLFFRLGNYSKNKPATIKNLGVIDSYFYGKSSVGAIAGLSNENSTITNSFSYGCLIYGDKNIGGISGTLLNAASIYNCYNTSVVKGNNELIGAISSHNTGTKAENCYYLSGVATDGNGVIQNGIGSGILGKAKADVEGQTTGLATVKEVVMAHGGAEAYLDYVERQLVKTDKANADEIERLQGELDVAEQALLDAKTALENADKANVDEIERLQGELDVAEQALLDAKSALENADKANADEIERLQAELNAKDAALEKADADNRLAIENAMNNADKSNKTLGIVGLVIGCVSFLGMLAMASFTFLKKKR